MKGSVEEASSARAGPPAAHRLPTVRASQGERAGVDLNRYRLSRFLLTNRAVRPTVQLVMVGLFAYALVQTFVGPQEAGTNFGAVAFFGLWWAPVMLISLVLVGRVWCYFCPIGAITQFVQRFGLGKRFPTYREKKWRAFGVGFSLLSITAATFLLARFPLYKLGVAFTPWAIGVYFLVFLVLAVGTALIFRQRAFCRYVCPATGVMSVTTRLSPIEIRQDRETKVPDCMTAEFKSPYLGTERRCVACMHCSEGQPDTPVRVRLRWPGAAAVRQRIPLPDEALIALIIWAIFPIDHVLGNRVGELAWVGGLPPLLSAAVPYVASVAATVAAFVMVTRIGARWSGLDPGRAFTRFAFAYVPLGIVFQLGRHTVTGLMESGGELVNQFAAGFGVSPGLREAWASPETIAAWSQFSTTGGLWLAVGWGAAIAWFIARDMTSRPSKAFRAWAPHVVLMCVSTYLVIGQLSA